MEALSTRKVVEMEISSFDPTRLQPVNSLRHPGLVGVNRSGPNQDSCNRDKPPMLRDCLMDVLSFTYRWRRRDAGVEYARTTELLGHRPKYRSYAVKQVEYESDLYGPTKTWVSQRYGGQHPGQ